MSANNGDGPFIGTCDCGTYARKRRLGMAACDRCFAIEESVQQQHKHGESAAKARLANSEREKENDVRYNRVADGIKAGIKLFWLRRQMEEPAVSFCVVY